MVTSLEMANTNNLEKITNLSMENSKYFDKLTEY